MKQLVVLLLLSSWALTARAQDNGDGPPVDPRSVKANQDSAAANLLKAQAAHTAGNWQQSRRFLAQSEKNGIVSAEFYRLLGQLYFDVKKYEQAERYWRRGYTAQHCAECGPLADQAKAARAAK